MTYSPLADTNEPRHNNNGRHALSEMRENLLMSHREASGIEMIDWASKRLNLRWNVRLSFTYQDIVSSKG